MTESEWDALEAERDAPTPDREPDLFDRPVAPAAAARSEAAAPAAAATALPANDLAARFAALRKG